jgi:hypothetical protein
MINIRKYICRFIVYQCLFFLSFLCTLLFICCDMHASTIAHVSSLFFSLVIINVISSPSRIVMATVDESDSNRSMIASKISCRILYRTRISSHCQLRINKKNQKYQSLICFFLENRYFESIISSVYANSIILI